MIKLENKHWQKYTCNSTDTHRYFFSFFFLNFNSHIWRRKCGIFLSVSDWFLSTRCSPVISIWLQMVEFYSWIMFCCVYIPHVLYLFIWWRTPWLIPSFGYCEQCFNKHCDAGILLIQCIHIFGYIPVVGLLDPMVSLFLVF